MTNDNKKVIRHKLRSTLQIYYLLERLINLFAFDIADLSDFLNLLRVRYYICERSERARSPPDNLKELIELQRKKGGKFV